MSDTLQIRFKVDNKTGYRLVAQGCFADWGDFAEPPSSADPFTTSSGGHVISPSGSYTGAAGMVGYKIEGEQTLYLRLLASNPYISEDNYVTAAVLSHNAGIGQGDYKWLYHETKDAHNNKTFEGKTLKVSDQIEQADDSSACFVITLE